MRDADRLQAILYEIQVRQPAVDRVLENTPQDAPIWPEQRLLRAFDQLMYYAKAMSLGDQASNPLDGKLDKR